MNRKERLIEPILTFLECGFLMLGMILYIAIEVMFKPLEWIE